MMLDGPRLRPFSGCVAKKLIVFLHGYGSDGNDLIALGREWARLLPDVAFVSPNAPERCFGAPMGRQWFPLTMRDPSEYWRGVVAARPALDAFLDAELARLNLSDKDLALVGFSQGTMIALHTGLRRRTSPAAILGFSGMLAGPEHLAEASARPRVLLVHGERDELIPLEAMLIAAQALGAAHIPASFHISYGIGHSIDRGGLDLGGRFLSQSLHG